MEGHQGYIIGYVRGLQFYGMRVWGMRGYEVAETNNIIKVKSTGMARFTQAMGISDCHQESEIRGTGHRHATRYSGLVIGMPCQGNES